MSTVIIIAHYGLEKRITQEECEAALANHAFTEKRFIDFELGHAQLSELYDLPYENMALAQQRKFNEILKPILQQNPTAHIAYFGLVPIPIGFHFGYLVGNIHPYMVFQWHHQKQVWYTRIDSPTPNYKFELEPLHLPQEVQKGTGEVTISIGTSFRVDQQAVYEVVKNPANEFEIGLKTPHVDSLHRQENIQHVVSAFQEVLDVYANKLSDRGQIHLFIASSAGLPFALGTRINPNIYPFVLTYQFSRDREPKYREAILISKEVNDRVVLTDEDKIMAGQIRRGWEKQLQEKIKPFIQTITGKSSANWLQTLSTSDNEYQLASQYLRKPWTDVINIGLTSLKYDKIELSKKDVDNGFDYIERTNTWSLDDGFLSGLEKRLKTNPNTDIMQSGRLFFFHEALHYSKSGHHLTSEIADGIGQFPKVIEEADYQADVWALLTEYRYSQLFETSKVTDGVKEFFCNAIESAVETMWSFVDMGVELESIQVRSMNRFLNWYWQWLQIENLDGKGKWEEVVNILFDKPVIEFAGAPMDLRAHRTYYKLNARQQGVIQLAAFLNNKVYRFTPNNIQDIVEGFRFLNGDKIRNGLKGFQVTIQ
jgi:hypothetical protein